MAAYGKNLNVELEQLKAELQVTADKNQQNIIRAQINSLQGYDLNLMSVDDEKKIDEEPLVRALKEGKPDRRNDGCYDFFLHRALNDQPWTLTDVAEEYSAPSLTQDISSSADAKASLAPDTKADTTTNQNSSKQSYKERNLQQNSLAITAFFAAANFVNDVASFNPAANERAVILHPTFSYARPK